MNKLFKHIFTPLIQNLYEDKKIPVDIYYLAGSRTGGKTYTLFELCTLLMNFCNQKGEWLRTDCYFFRATKEPGSLESYQEFLDNWKDKADIIMETKKDRVCENSLGNRIRFLGANTLNTSQSQSANSGLSMRNDRDLIFVCVEEAQQIDLDQLKNAFLSLRSNPNTQFVYVFAMNPTNMSHPSVREAMKVCSPNLHLLKTKGFCFSSKNVVYKFGNDLLMEKRFCSWNNFMTCKDDEGNWLISKTKIKELLDLNQTNPDKAICDVWGFPYSIGGLCYKTLERGVIVPERKRFEKFTAGLDVAGGRTKWSAINALIITGWVDDEHAEVVQEYIFNQKEANAEECTTRNKASWFLQNLYEFLSNYSQMTNDYESEIEVRVDLSAPDFISELNLLCSNDRIRFVPCRKVLKCENGEKSSLNKRVEYANNAFIKGTLKIWNTCTDLLQQLQNCEYKENRKGEISRQDKDNDCIDAFDYSLCFEWNYI